MKKEMLITLLFSAIGAIFCIVASYWDTLRTHIPIGKELILIILLIFTQSQALNSLKDSFFNTNPEIIRAKRRLFSLHNETAGEFTAMYKTVLKIHTFDAVSFLLAHLDMNNLTDENYRLAKKWLRKEEPFPYKQLRKKKTRTRLAIATHIRDFEDTETEYEDLYYSCMAGKILDVEKKQSIVESILVWLSYFYFLIEIFNINLSDHTAIIITFIMITIMDIAKHYTAFKKQLKKAQETIDRFYSKMQQTYSTMHDAECLYITIDGERIPCKNFAETEENDTP